MGFDKKSAATKYTPQDDDTLEQIAERETGGKPLTAQDIAKFNWGTDDSDVIQEHLRDELGCYAYDPDKNFLISADVETRSDLLIPKPFTKNGLATDRTHTLKTKKTPAPPKQFEACYKIDGVHFEFDKSFILPSVVGQLKDLEDGLKAHPDAKVMVFGHTDHVGSVQYNKDLSDRRALSVYAFITNQPDIWENELYNHPNEKWGIKSVQYILKDMGGPYDPGPVDGINGPLTRTAVENFQRDNGLAVDGIAGPITRTALFDAYMSGKHDIDIGDDRFMEPKHVGCSEYNPVVPASESAVKEIRDAENAPNRRVTFYLFNEARLPALPCEDGSTGPCEKRLRPAPPPGQTDDLFRCTCYDSIAKDCQNEIGPVVPAINPVITVQQPVVVVKKQYTNPARQPVNLTTDAAFDGTGTFTRSSNAIRFFTAAVGGAEITFNGADNVFTGAQLTAGLDVFAEGATASGALDDVTLTLTLAPGAAPVGPAANATMTSVELTLEICQSRTAAGADPNPLNANDKINTGRFVQLQDAGNHCGRAKLIVRQAQPATFASELEIKPTDNKAQLFADEVAAAGQAAIATPHAVANNTIPADGSVFWAQGTNVSVALRDTGFQLGIKDLEEDGDRVAITVVRFRDLKADIPSTPANRNRLGNSPVNRHDLIIAGGGPGANDFDEDYAVNEPLVLVEGSIRATDRINLSVVVEPAGVGVPVSWSAQRDRRPAPDGDHANVIALDGNSEAPTITPDGGDPLKATLLADAAGSFHIFPFVDGNGNGRFDFNDNTGTRIDREPFLIMNLVLIRVKGINNLSVAHIAPNAVSGWQVDSENGLPANQHATDMKALIKVVGGGDDGKRGLDMLFAGWVNNELASPGSPTVPQTEDVVHIHEIPPPPPPPPPAVPPPIVRRTIISCWVSSPAMGGNYTNPATVLIIEPDPVLDSGYANQGTGGNTCVGTEGANGPPVAIAKTDRPDGIGQNWEIIMWDSPGGPIHQYHPDIPAAQVVDFRFNIDFRSDLVFWTNRSRTQGPADHPACRLYSSVQTNTWIMRARHTWDAAFVETVVVPYRVTLIKDPVPTRRAIPVDGSGLETRLPDGLSMLAEDRRN